MNKFKKQVNEAQGKVKDLKEEMAFDKVCEKLKFIVSYQSGVAGGAPLLTLIKF